MPLAGQLKRPRWSVLLAALMCLAGSRAITAQAAPPASAYPDPREPLHDRCWQRTFEDTFDELDLYDSAKRSGRWKTAYIWGNDIVINGELQYYVDPRRHPVTPFSQQDGVIEILADRTPTKLKASVDDRAYVSGLLTSEESFSQYHGRFEARLKPPAGQGLWAAFWLLPSFDTWPDGVDILPEIDVMEVLGHDPYTFHTTLHTNQSGQLQSYPKAHSTHTDLSRAFHLYSVVWNATGVHWYFDRRWVASESTPKDFTRPVHLLLNLAVGGEWPGAPDTHTRFPARYALDYVRVWRANGQCPSSE